MRNEERPDPATPEIPDTPAMADDRPEELPAAGRRWLAPEEEGAEEAGYGYGV